MTARTTTLLVDGRAAMPPTVAFDRVLAVDPTATFTGRGVLPAVIATEHLSGGWARVGAVRELSFSDEGTAREELIEFVPGERYAYTVSDFTGVVRHLLSGMRCEWRFAAAPDGAARLQFAVRLTPLPRRDLIARRLFAPLWRRYMADVMGRTLERIDTPLQVRDLW